MLCAFLACPSLLPWKTQKGCYCSRAKEKVKLGFPLNLEHVLFTLNYHLSYSSKISSRKILRGGECNFSTVDPTHLPGRRKPWSPPRAIFGHLHMSKTGGTTLNGNLSLHYERICGHKGYSYDAIKANCRYQRYANQKYEYSDGSGISILNPGYNRGRVPNKDILEIGFENCDYVSMETDWRFWPANFGNWPLPLELHVPCRNPVDHVLSMCNAYGVDLKCGKSLIPQVHDCLRHLNRFHMDLTNKTRFSNIDVYCYDYAVQFSDYISYLSERLQPRRFHSSHVHKPTNKPRQKVSECVLKHPELENVLRSYLVANVDYWKFCDLCIGSPNDLFPNKVSTDSKVVNWHSTLST
mmetsp:Transcript_42499/g.100861  ORF Transcript_42499/g.100861 Transcript_42499/m.100861 type:complete len:353 (+) Transcript_42499:398-1456(+)